MIHIGKVTARKKGRKKIKSTTTKTAKIQRLVEEEKRDKVRWRPSRKLQILREIVDFAIFNDILSQREMDNEGTTRENSRVF